MKPSILFIGCSESFAAPMRRLKDRGDIQMLICSRIEHGLALLSSNSGIALVLLLWQERSPALLPQQVQSIFEAHGNAPLAVLVRSQNELSPMVKAALWQLGIVDKKYYQPLDCVELMDSLSVALRNCRRQITLTSIPALAEVFSSAKTLRDLALLSMQVVPEQGLPTCGGLFCYAGDSPAHDPVVIAGTACHEDHNCIALKNIADQKAKNQIQCALDQRTSLFGTDGVAIYLLTAGGVTACIYFTLSASLCPWDVGVLHGITDMISTAIDQLQMTRQLQRTKHATILTLSSLAEYRDVDTGEHVARVARMTTEIAHVLSAKDAAVDANFLKQIGLASILHDTGKIAIPDSILLKPGKLNPEERREMEKHAVLGSELLHGAVRRSDDNGLMTMAAQVARHHHERFDGKGYPDGLQGEGIPLASRIVALVDVYDALICKRPYKQPWSQEKTIELICSESGRHFDSKVVDALVQLDEMRKVARHIEWSDIMSVGNDELDNDHKHLIEIINRLWLAESMGNRQIIEFVLDDLVSYTEFHFDREERLLEKVDFSDKEHHFKIHNNIRHRLEAIRREYFLGIRDELRSGLLEFVTVWLNKHILEEDMQYSSYFGQTV